MAGVGTQQGQLVAIDRQSAEMGGGGGDRQERGFKTRQRRNLTKAQGQEGQGGIFAISEM